MKYREECEECGHAEAAYTHRINKTMVGAFITFVEMYLRVRRSINVNTEIRWNHNQLASFRQLKFFGLIAKSGKDGFWHPTVKGVAFYYRDAPVISPVASLNDQVLPDNHRAWETHGKDRQILFINDIEETHHKRRPEYQAELSPQRSIFDESATTRV